jgi:hypothetical protein
MQKIIELWELLPQEVKVAGYIALSYGLSEIVIQLSKVEVSNIWLAILINILLVFFKNLRPRLDKSNQ